MITFEKSKKGELTAKFDNFYLHSSYSPSNEADKFFKINNLNNFSTFIIFSPCLNYLGKVIKKYISGAKIISIYYYSEFYVKDKYSDYTFLFNGSNVELIDSVKTIVNEEDIEGLKIIEWPSSYKINKEYISQSKLLLLQHIRQLYGNITTISGFGKRSFKNYLTNFNRLKKICIPKKMDAPILIAGSGPGLKSDLDFIKKNRSMIMILALPSSLYYLFHNNIIPDLIITTDPGYYAKLHLSDISTIPVAAPYTASLPKTDETFPLLPINQDYFLDSQLLDFNESFIKLKSHGTVAGSALFLSLQLTDAPIFISGLDFSFEDLLSHNRPHTFDNLIDKNSNRFSGLQNIYFNRNISTSEQVSQNRRSNKSLKTYEGWFANNSKFFNSRCFFLDYYTNPPGNFKNLSHSEAELLLKKDVSYSFSSYEISDNNRIFKTNNVIKNYLDIFHKLQKECMENEVGKDLYNILNNDFFFNLFLPELLEFKRHYLNKNGKDVSNKAVSLINKSITFLEELNFYE